MLKVKPRASKLTKHRSSAPSGPLPLSLSHTHIYSHRGNGYRWPPDAFATITIVVIYGLSESLWWSIRLVIWHVCSGRIPCRFQVECSSPNGFQSVSKLRLNKWQTRENGAEGSIARNMHYGVSIKSPWYSASIDTNSWGFGEEKKFLHTSLI